MLQQLSELGYLYRKIQSAIRERSGSQIGAIEQSLYHALQEEMTAYYRLIATMESRIRSQQLLCDIHSLLDMQLPLTLDPDTGITLVRLAVWTEHMKLRMRMMGVLVEGVQREFLFAKNYISVFEIFSRRTRRSPRLSDLHLYLTRRPLHSKIHRCPA